MQTYPNPCAEKAGPIKKWILVLLGMALSVSAEAQNMERARKTLEKLSSENFAGRGYLENGHTKAAAFIRKKFKQLGLKPLGGSYYQNFTITQNLFPRNPELSLNGRKLVPGKDFIPAPDCPSLNGKFSIRKSDTLLPFPLEKFEPKQAWLSSKKISKKWLNSPYRKLGLPSLFLDTASRLTHSLSENSGSSARLIIKKESFSPVDSLLECSLYAKTESIETRNVIGMLRGTQFPDSFLVVCAHYDHLGKIGTSTLFPGANDNASGTAFMLELAAWFSKKPLPWSLLFIAFSAEEAGLQGSRYLVQHPPVSLSRIRFVMNLDLIGFGDKGATVVNGTVHEKEFRRLVSINSSKGYLPEIKARGKAANSDHYPFSEMGVPAFFLYTLGGPGHYHDISDRAETVTFSGFINTFGLVRDFLEGF
jgi:hypothetical protein